MVSVMSFLRTGTSPSSPNIALRTCMRNAGYYRMSSDQGRNKFSTLMRKWCSVQESVLPCVQKSIENNSLRSPSDWFFSMTFDLNMARRTSIAMCKKLKKFGKKLKCINSSSLQRARLCVKTLTMPLRQTLTGLYVQNKTNSYDARRLACIISAATATCYKEKIRSCRSYLRDYIGAYHVILGGKCLSVLPATPGELVNDSIIMPRQADRNWITIVQSLLKEVGIQYFPQSMISEIQSTMTTALQKTSLNALSTAVPLTTDGSDDGMFAPETDDNFTPDEFDITENTTVAISEETFESNKNDSINDSIEFDTAENTTSLESNFTSDAPPLEDSDLSFEIKDTDDVREDDKEVTTEMSGLSHDYTLSAESTESPRASASVTASLSKNTGSPKLPSTLQSLLLALVVISIPF
ncbi:uncharacterized protein LOC111134485 isoform X2 [Crassostrea virginica]